MADDEENIRRSEERGEYGVLESDTNFHRFMWEARCGE
jgi:hypothetical protein